MQYKVTYTVPTKPLTLPEGAEVTEVPSLPLLLKTNFERTVEVNKEFGGGSFVEIQSSHRASGDYAGAILNASETRQLRDALSEALGEKERPVTDGEVSLPFEFRTEFSDRKVGIQQGRMGGTSERYLYVGQRPGAGGLSGSGDQKIKLNRDERKKLADALYSTL